MYRRPKVRQRDHPESGVGPEVSISIRDPRRNENQAQLTFGDRLRASAVKRGLRLRTQRDSR